MAKDEIRKPDDQNIQEGNEAGEPKRRKRGASGADDAGSVMAATADVTRDVGAASTQATEDAIDAAVHATTHVTPEATRKPENAPATVARASSAAMTRAMDAGKAAAAGLAAMTEAPTPRPVAGAAFPPALDAGAAGGAAKAAKVGGDQLDAVVGELSNQLSALMEDNAELFERMSQARNVPAVMIAYQNWLTKRMSRTAGLQWAMWNAWTRTVQSAISSAPTSRR